jgi:hypothetical protein
MENKEPNCYAKILEAIFKDHFKRGKIEIEKEDTDSWLSNKQTLLPRAF